MELIIIIFFKLFSLIIFGTNRPVIAIEKVINVLDKEISPLPTFKASLTGVKNSPAMFMHKPRQKAAIPQVTITIWIYFFIGIIIVRFNYQ